VLGQAALAAGRTAPDPTHPHELLDGLQGRVQEEVRLGHGRDGRHLRGAPRVAFGFIEHESQFTATATRWRFG